jgi:peptidyl-dipeptidase A
MDTMLHEEGHAVYDLGIDPSMRFVLRDPAQPFTTEAVAMFFGALGKSPEWMVAYAGADPDRVDALREAILQQRRCEQLTFCRFTIVMFNFERALYENPRQDLNRLWWQMVEKYQGLHAPEGRGTADWAAKMHFHGAPVYYQNYMLGDLFSSQLRRAIERRGIQGWTPELGRYFTDSVFRSGSLLRWPEFVESATGEPLSAKAFADEVKQ